jgi:hypothetical protein
MTNRPPPAAEDLECIDILGEQAQEEQVAVVVGSTSGLATSAVAVTSCARQASSTYWSRNWCSRAWSTAAGTQSALRHFRNPISCGRSSSSSGPVAESLGAISGRVRVGPGTGAS